MPNINAPMYGNNRVHPSCVGGRDCCRMPMKTKRAVRQAEMREELALADSENDSAAYDAYMVREDDLEWDGYAYDPEDVYYVNSVKFVDATGLAYGDDGPTPKE